MNVEKLRASGCEVRTNEPMSAHTTFKIGGAADVMALPGSEEQLLAALVCAREAGEETFILGNGSNLLVRDGGLGGLTIKLGDNYSGAAFKKNTVTAKCGTRLIMLSRDCMQKGLAGLHFAGGIPGTVGGAVYMNAGAYEHALSEVCTQITCLNEKLEKVSVPNEQAGFGYRTSSFQTNGYIVLEASFELAYDSGGEARKNYDLWNARRREKQPVNMPCAGSVFKRPPGNYAGALIEAAGLKGLRVGGAEVSALHAGFIVNTGGATAQDVLQLMEEVKRRVLETSGVALQEEIRIVGRSGE